MAEDENELLLTEEVEEQDGETAEQPEDGDDISIEIEGEDPVEETPAMRELRTRLRDTQKELADRRKAEHPKPIDPGPKPTLWDDAEGDEDKYDSLKAEWDAKVAAFKSAQQGEQSQVEIRNREFERAKVTYQAKAQQLGVKNFDTAEKTVLDTLGSDYLGWIIQYADDPVKLVGALGTHPGILAKVEAESDPMRRLKLMVKLEAQVKVTNKRKPPPPEAETIVRGSAPLSTSVDKESDKLLKEAQRTNDYTAYMKRQRELRKKA